MRRIGLVAVALVLGLTACAHDRMSRHMPPRKANPHFPVVEVAMGKYIVIDQEPIVVPSEEKNFKIAWGLSAEPGYEFPDDGIMIVSPGGEFDCNVEQGRQRFVCIFHNSKPGRYKYVINVRDPQGRPLRPLDPFIVND